MKKVILAVLLFSIPFILFSQEFTITLRKDLLLTDDYGTEYNYKKGDKFIYKIDKDGFGVSRDEPLRIKIYFDDSEGNRCDSQINDVSLEDYDYKMTDDIKNYYWIPSYYYTVSKEENVRNSLFRYEPYWKTFTFVAEDDPEWYEFFGIRRYFFGDFYFVVFGGYYYNDVDFFAYLEEVSDTRIVYNVQKMYSHFFDYKEELYYNQPDFLPLFEKETPFKIILTIDGDYMKMYIDEVSEGNLFQTLVRTTPEACNQLEEKILYQLNGPSESEEDSYMDYIYEPMAEEESDWSGDELPVSDVKITEDIQPTQEPVAVVEQTSNLLLIIILASAGVLLLVIVLVVVVARKKKKESNDLNI